MAAEQVARGLGETLGMPAEGPTLSVRGGDVLESAGEVALVAFWEFPARDRERARAAVEHALLAEAR